MFEWFRCPCVWVSPSEHGCLNIAVWCDLMCISMEILPTAMLPIPTLIQVLSTAMLPILTRMMHGILGQFNLEFTKDPGILQNDDSVV